MKGKEYNVKTLCILLGIAIIAFLALIAFPFGKAMIIISLVCVMAGIVLMVYAIRGFVAEYKEIQELDKQIRELEEKIRNKQARD